MRRSIPIFASLIWLVFASNSRAIEPKEVERWLVEGRLAEGEKALTDWLGQHPADDTARFGLGVTQFVRGIERLGQSLHNYGMRIDAAAGLIQLPVLRLPVGDNPDPKPMKYEDARQVLLDWLADLQKAEKTLAAIKDDNVKLPLRVSNIRWDWDGNGTPGDKLIDLVRRFFGPATPADLTVTFDRADVAWLRGYCHLLMVFCEFPLAHDGRELFDVSAHLFFKNAQTPGARLRNPQPNQPTWSEENIVDLIAFVHMLRLPVKEPERMKACWEHLRMVIETGRESWRFIRAETDDDQEWIPNSKQTSVLGIRMSDEMIDSWLVFLDEADDLLQGRRLIPFWRKHVMRGINLKRVFLEPRGFDLVLWVQGTAAVPYLEDGPHTRPEVWQRLQRVFRGEFIGFALWFN